MPDRTAQDVRQEWGDVLRLERLRRRLAQEDVAQLAGIRSATVSRMENGRGSLDVFLSVAKALDVTLTFEAEEVAS